MSRLIVVATLISAALLLCIQCASETRTQNDGIYSSVPEPQRDSLREAVNRMISLRKASKWDSLFEFFYNERRLTKEQYIREEEGLSKLIEFVPIKVSYYPPEGIWIVHGCAVFDPRPSKTSGAVFSLIQARLTLDRWMLSDIGVEVPKDPKDPQPCSGFNFQSERNGRNIK